MKIMHGAATDKGMVRERNEDAYFHYIIPSNQPNKRGHLFIVADGIGGSYRGDIASGIAVNVFPRIYYDSPDATVRDRLASAFMETDYFIFEESRKEEGGSMGTTLAALVIQKNVAHIANLGDSRVYLLRGSKLKQLTKDHTMSAEMEELEEHTPEEIRRYKNVVTRYLGDGDEKPFDFFTVEIHKKDTFLLCSDGLYIHVSDSEVAKIIECNPPQKACSILINLAKSRGGKDNITLQVIKLAPPEVKLLYALGSACAALLILITLYFIPQPPEKISVIGETQKNIVPSPTKSKVVNINGSQPAKRRTGHPKNTKNTVHQNTGNNNQQIHHSSPSQPKNQPLEFYIYSNLESRIRKQGENNAPAATQKPGIKPSAQMEPPNIKEPLNTPVTVETKYDLNKTLEPSSQDTGEHNDSSTPEEAEGNNKKSHIIQIKPINPSGTEGILPIPIPKPTQNSE